MKIENAKTRETTIDLKKPNDYPKRTSSFTDQYRTEITYLPVSKLFPYRNQARLLFNQEDIDALALTIQEHGIRQPLTVLRILSDDVCFEVVSGERRLRAAKQIGLLTVPCIIISDENKAEEIALIENVQRKDLHPIELARTLKKLIEKSGYGAQTEIKKKVGLSQPQISELVKLAELPVSVQEEMLRLDYRGRDNFRHLCRLQSEEKQLEYLKKPFEKKQKKSKDAHMEKEVDVKNSLLRLSIENGKIKAQRGKIANLSDDKKKELVSILTDILMEIAGEKTAFI